MNTPAHTVVNLVMFGHYSSSRYVSSIITGSLLPDLPMFLFYLVQKLVYRNPEGVIWNESYFNTWWQNFFDIFNSIPLICLGLLVAWKMKSKGFGYFFASMLLHIILDLPFHNDDAHRHFFPLSNWRFESPISYWDPAHYGGVLITLEALVVSVCCYVLLRKYHSRTSRIAISGLISVYILYFAFALIVWA